MSQFRNDRHPIIVPCTKCGQKYEKMQAGSADISSLRFPQYSIQRYKDLESKPREINLCDKCCDKLDKFLYIYDYDGEDYYKEEKDLEFLFKSKEEYDEEEIDDNE